MRFPKKLALLLALSLGLAAPPAIANPFTILKVFSKAAKMGSKGASTAGKAAKGAASAGKATKGVTAAAKVAAASGGLVAAERAGLLFKLVPDEIGRVPVYLTREGDSLSLIRRSGDVAETSDVAWRGAIDDLRTAEAPSVDVYLDTTAALDPPPMDGLTEARLFAVDKDGTPHRVRKKADDDGWELEDGQDLVEFALEQLADLEDTGLTLADAVLVEEPVEIPVEEPVDPAVAAQIAAEKAEAAAERAIFKKGYGVFLFGLCLLGVREYRKPTEIVG